MNRSRARWLLVVVGVLLWLVVVLAPYYVIHKPLGSESPFPLPTITVDAQNITLAILGILADLGLFALTLVVAAAWGSRIAGWIGLTFDSGLEHWALSATLSLGLLGTLVFGLGAVGGLYRWVGYLVVLILGVTALPEIRELVHWLSSGLRRLRPNGIPWVWLFAGLIALFSLGQALLPPTSWDALVYHLHGPRLYLEAHRLIAVPENYYLNWPAQVEMLFTWGMLLKGDTLAKLFNWVFWPLTAALLYALARRRINARAGRWAVALWASVPVAAELASVAYVDLGLTAFVLAGFYAFLNWTDSQGDRWLVLSALFLGLTMATKYTAASWLAGVGLLFIYHAWRHQRRPLGWIVTRGVGLTALAGVVVLPWLIKNWIVTGNPIYPFLFGGAHWNPTRSAWLSWVDQSYSRNLLDYLALPWLATVLGTSGSSAFDATIGPLLLVLVPLVFLARHRPQSVNYGLVLVGVQLLFFCLTIYFYAYLVETRLFLAAFPLLCLAAAYALQRLPAWDRPSFRLSWLVSTVSLLVLVLTLVTETQAFLAARPLAPLAGLEKREDYLTRRLGAYYATMHHLNEHLAGDTHLLFLWEPRGYYCTPPALADATLDNLAQLRVAYGSAETALIGLRAGGFTHLLFYRSGMEFLRQPTPPPPTLNTFWGQPTPQESNYPFTTEDLLFLENLLALCQPVSGDIYELYQLP